MVQYIHVPFLSTLAACVVHGGCIAVAVWLMPALSINMALALIIINAYDDLISLFLLKERQREEREGGREGKKCTGKRNLPFTYCVYSLHVCDIFYRYRH